jgi:hypothetical protein
MASQPSHEGWATLLKRTKMKFWKILFAFIFTLALLVAARKTTTVKSVHKTVEKGGILIEHDTVPKRRGEGNAVIFAKVMGADKVRLLYRIGEGEFQAVRMDMKEGEGDLFAASVPHQEKGVRAWYYIEAQRGTGERQAVVTLPDKSSPDFDPILLKFQGQVPSHIILAHIICLFVAIFFSVLATLSAVDLKRGKGTLKKTVAFSIVTFIFLFMGFFPLGWALNYYAYGVLWEAFPFGSDVTDNKGQIAFISWLVTLLLIKGTIFRKDASRNWVSEKGFSTAVIISFVITIAMYLIPHSLIL